VLVVRSENKLYCTCYNEVTQEASRTCPICFGIGWGLVAERHRTRSVSSNPAQELSRFLNVADIGEVSVKRKVYYFKPTMKAKQKDLVVEVSWDRLGRPKYEGKGIWQVDKVDDDYHLKDGQYIFKACQASEKPVRSTLRAIRISQINGIVQYNVYMEG
jgi:hypothetical protein